MRIGQQENFRAQGRGWICVLTGRALCAHSARMATGQRRKREHEKVVRINITLTPVLYTKLEDIMRAKGYSGPSEFMATHVRKQAGLEDENQLPLFKR